MDLTTIFDVIKTVSVIIGVVYGMIQLRQYKSDRRREAALLVLNSFQTPNFMRGLMEVVQMPDGLDMKGVRDHLGDNLEIAMSVLLTFERIGVLVFQRELTLDIVDDALSGPIMISWSKLAKTVTEIRDAQNRETSFEWYQWLAERMSERESLSPPVPAYIEHADWKP
jgi:hypothetical protein